MACRRGAVAHSPSLPDTVTPAKPREREATVTRCIPPYHVILLNDDFHSMDFVVQVLRRVLGCSLEKALQFMLMAHRSGRAIIWTGTREVAELKVEQIRT